MTESAKLTMNGLDQQIVLGLGTVLVFVTRPALCVGESAMVADRENEENEPGNCESVHVRYVSARSELLHPTPRQLIPT